jgi:hypothetical protein
MAHRPTDLRSAYSVLANLDTSHAASVLRKLPAYDRGHLLANLKSTAASKWAGLVVALDHDVNLRHEVALDVSIARVILADAVRGAA